MYESSVHQNNFITLLYKYIEVWELLSFNLYFKKHSFVLCSYYE